MLVFVDESGDPGRKTDAGSSRFFIITTVVFPDRAVAQQCDDSIGQLRTDLKLSPHKEFHFNKEKNEIKEAFLRCVMKSEFWYSAVILNKDLLTGPGFNHKDSLYKYTVRLAFENIFDELNEAIIVFDRCGGREFTAQLKAYLRRNMNTKAGNSVHGKIKKVRDDHSHSNNLLQMADMVCGALAKCYASEKPGRAQFRNIVRRRERRVQVWPRLSRQ